MARILVVDDEPDVRALLLDTLTGAGHDVRLEVDGRAGLAAAIRAWPELILLDWMMPALDGLEVCQRLRATRRLDRIPVVMLTARQRQAEIEWGYGAGADDVLVKPFSPRALLWRIESTLVRGRRPAPLRPPAG